VKKQLLTWIKDNVPPGSVDTSELDKLWKNLKNLYKALFFHKKSGKKKFLVQN
jgi:hypothetical protein